MRAAAQRWWPDVPCTSAAALIRALRHFGVETRLDHPDYVLLTRGELLLAVLPLRDSVHPAVLRGLLTALEVSVEELAEHLEP
jgi:hypothetical protein